MPAQPRAFTTHRCPDSSLLSSELRGSSAMSSTGKPPPAPALGGSTSACSDTSESHSQPLLLLPAKSSSQPLLLLCVSPALLIRCNPCLLPAAAWQPGSLGTSTEHTPGTRGRAQPNVHQGVSFVSQSSKILRTVQGAPATLRSVRDSIRYLTLFRPPSRSTLNCS